ncbi:MAG: ferritin-like domain-containing protein [Actinomycetota bacterium]|nr:ferritin-like domain-containing protein [Actinomycetota bacterium]
MPYSNLAVPELGSVQVDGLTRQAFILRGALAVGAVYGAATIGPFVGQALAQEKGAGGDVDVLNFALTLEYLETEFYERALELTLSPGVRVLARTFGTHERDHVDALKDTIASLGGTPVEKPKASFPMGSERAFLKLAQTLEETGLSAYNGAAPRIRSPEVLAAAGSIAQIEARHAAAIREARGLPPAPRAFDESLEVQQVLEAVEPFVRS